MTELEKKIFEVIAKSNGIKGSQIANALQVEKKTVNSTLASSKELKALVKQDSEFKWHLITAAKGGNPATNVPQPDEDLKRLCNYYLQCITLESNSSVSQFLESKFDYEYAVLNGLGIDAKKDVSAIKLLNKIAADREKKAFLGYPVQIFTIRGKGGISYKKIAPVFLFPVEYNAGNIEVSWVPTFNIEVLGRYAVGSKETLAKELVDLQTELGMNNPDIEIEVDELILRLVQLRSWEWAEKIDPYQIPKAGMLTDFEEGIYNRPILISASKQIFTEGLESELMTLSMMPTDNFRGTALFSWLKDEWSEYPTANSTKQLLEVLPLNTEQSLAVETALNSDLTIVTGPPGTGKSQVVTDLLANIAWNGKSALFSSRNNKAVDVVEKRVNALSGRPSLLRVGAAAQVPTLAEIISGLLNSPATQKDQSDLQSYLKQYDSLNTQETSLKAQKLKIIQDRNQLDEAEQSYCQYRDLIGDMLFKIPESEVGKVSMSANQYSSAIYNTKRENNGFFARLFWGSVEPKRIAAMEAAEKEYEAYAQKYGLPHPNHEAPDSTMEQILGAASTFENALPVAFAYRNALTKEHNSATLEQLDKEISAVISKRADLAQQIWDKWLRSTQISFSVNERKEMSSFISAVRLGDEVQPAFVTKMVQLATRYLHCWAVTSLSAKRRIPFEPGIFDYVIIDEASQCDIASIIPLLFRSKRAVIIGDPQQLQHISQLTQKQDLALLKKYEIDNIWSYSVNSLYSLARTLVDPNNIIQLRDHFRSCSEIIEFSNEAFYDGTLRTATRYSGLKPPPGERPGIRWINVKGKTIRPPYRGSAFNREEVDQVVRELQRLVDAGYKGSIGVTTPFNLQAQEIKQAIDKIPALKNELEKNHEFIADTVHKFQGDERDVMIFSSVVSDSAAQGTVGFLSNTGNLFNVAITRARSTLVVVGDYQYCANCSIQYLNQFANYYARLNNGRKKANSSFESVGKTREYPASAKDISVSEWEKVLYTALYDAGINTAPQYSADRYSLDLALLLPNDRKLDIEVDGQMYHQQWNGEHCYRDQLRNQRLFELGWDVKRFWVYQVRDDIDWCVEQVKQWIDQASDS